MDKFENCNMETFDMRQALEKFWNNPQPYPIYTIGPVSEMIMDLETKAFKAGGTRQLNV